MEHNDLNYHNINLGGYDKNAFNDGKGVNHLESLFYSSDILMPHFKTEDKTPNFDGYFELLAPGVIKSTPIGRYDVQIKSLDRDYRNHNKNAASDYKYSCETKAINGVICGITLNPVMLFLVDIHTRDVYYIYLSFEYCMKLNIGTQENKTIYFSDEDRITDLQNFYAKAKRIYETQRNNLISLEIMKYSLPDTMTKVPDEVRNCCDYLNEVMDHELSFIKRAFFPNVWKFGIAYMPYDDNHGEKITSGQLGIYFIKKGENGYLIREFKDDEEYPFMFIFHGHTLDGLIKSKIKEFINVYFQRKAYIPSMLPNLALREIVFKQIDRHAFYKVAREADKEYNKKKKKQKQNNRYHLTYQSDQIGLVEAIQILKDQTYTENGTENDDLYALACIEVLRQRGYSEIKRVWACSYESFAVKEKYGIRFEPVIKQEVIDRENALRMQDGIEEFYTQMIKLADADKRDIFKSDLSYVAVTDENEAVNRIYKFKSDRFSIRFIKDNDPEAEKYLKLINSHKSYDESEMLIGMHSFRPDLMEYSWEKFWRSYVESRCLQLIGYKRGFFDLVINGR